jgi:conjugative transposon TraK protein
MFQQMKNIDTAFKYVRAFSFTLILCCMSLSAFVMFKSYQWVQSAQSKIYILANGKAFEALAAERKDNVAVEARDHVKTFHEYFFTLDPDNKVIETNISKALYMADASAKRQYEDLKESGYYAGIIAGNISQQISVDSITVDINQYPFYFKCYSTERIIRATSTTTRSLITEGYLRNVTRSDNNSHGFLIERWETLQNMDIKTENR